MEVPQYWNGTIPWVTPKDMKTLAIGDSRIKVTQAAVDETSLRVIGDAVVLLVVRGMILARKVPIAWTRCPLTINQDMKAISPSEGIDARYLATLLDSARDAFFPLIDEAGHGTKRLPTERLRNIFITVPPLEEQAAIVRYLDHVDRRVRRLVRAKRKLIALLTEQKQAIIHRAVTRGLDPDVPMKDSGVEWLGEVPAHWEVARLRNVTASVTSGSRGWSLYAADNGPLFIRVANLSRMSLDLRFDDVVRLNLPETSEVIRTRVRPGDVLLSITAYIGSVAVVPEEFEEAYVSQHVARCEIRDGAHNPRWVGYVLLSEVGQRHGKLSLYGGTKDGISLDDVKSYPLLLPPRQEQEQLVTEIEEKVGYIDGAIVKANREIELLTEYRTRLTADVVTGKLDVREVAAALPEIDPLAADDDLDTLDAEFEPELDELEAIAEDAEA